MDKQRAPADYSLVYLQEQRIQKLEELTIQFAAHTATEEMKFEMISNQIKDLGDRVEEGLTQLRTEIQDLKGQTLELKDQTNQHHEYLNKLQHERHEEELEQLETKRKKRKLLNLTLAGAAALLAGFFTKFGEHIWQWLFRK